MGLHSRYFASVPFNWMKYTYSVFMFCLFVVFLATNVYTIALAFKILIDHHFNLDSVTGPRPLFPPLFPIKCLLFFLIFTFEVYHKTYASRDIDLDTIILR